MAVTQAQIDEAVRLAKEYGATRVILFGSAVDRPEEARDLDIAVDGLGGWEFFGYAADLEETLRIPVDVIPLSPESDFVKYITRKGRLVHAA
jgi:predicted nucleotidyltransferase